MSAPLATRPPPPAARAVALLLCLAVVVGACQQGGPPSAEPVARAYAEAWQRGDIRAMWDLLTDEARQRTGEPAFVERWPRIAEEMSLRSLEARAGRPVQGRTRTGTPAPDRADVPLAVRFRTERVGDIEREVMLRLVLVGAEGQNQGQWRIDWTPEMFLPQLSPGRLVRMTRLPTSRGRILARDGSELATFTEAALVGVVPGQIRSEQGMLASLSAALGMPAAQIRARYTAAWVRPEMFVPIRAVTDPAVRARVEVIEGVQIRPQRVRGYPTGLAAQTIGHLAEATAEDLRRHAERGVVQGDLVGRTGLEATLEPHIGGRHGWRLAIIEPNAQPVETLGERAPVPGADAVLSLDPVLQRAAEEALGEQKGAIVVMDPTNGELLAVASRPSFDPSVFVTQDAAAIGRLNTAAERPLFNRATSGEYATGSTFKMITAAAAMRHGVFRAGDRVDCPHRWTGFGEQWAQLNHDRRDLGPIDLRAALARSCNTFFYELAKRLEQRNSDLLPQAARAFGLGEPTGTEFVFESAGVVPSREWKARRFADRPAERGWNPGDATNLAIGQGFMVATPLQMAGYTAALANGGTVWKPRLVTALRGRDGAPVRGFEAAQRGKVEIGGADLAAIADGMRAVTADLDGTVHGPFHGFGVATGGKSGTAEIGRAGAVNAWFVGYAPLDAPTLAVATVLEEFPEAPGRHGSQEAATATRRVLGARFGVP